MINFCIIYTLRACINFCIIYNRLYKFKIG